jgi:hypothetical protein
MLGYAATMIRWPCGCLTGVLMLAANSVAMGASASSVRDWLESEIGKQGNFPLLNSHSVSWQHQLVIPGADQLLRSIAQRVSEKPDHPQRRLHDILTVYRASGPFVFESKLWAQERGVWRYSESFPATFPGYSQIKYRDTVRTSEVGWELKH